MFFSCGPDYNGEGYVNYDLDPDGYYDSASEAFATYCPDNRLGDWRIDDNCHSSDATRLSIVAAVQIAVVGMALFVLR